MGFDRSLASRLKLGGDDELTMNAEDGYAKTTLTIVPCSGAA